MAAFKTWLLVLCTLFAIFLVASAEASTQKIKEDKVGNGVEESKYPGGYGGYPGGGYGGYPGGGSGGYPGGGGGGRYGGYPGGGRYGGGGRSGGYCRYGCCRGYRYGGCYRCCSHSNEAPDAEFQAEP